MGLNGVSVNNANEERFNYDSLNGRITEAEYNASTHRLAFRDEEGTTKFATTIEQEVVNVDATLTTEGDAADAKKVGDEIDRIEDLIPSIDTTLSVVGSAADAGATGSAITNAMNHVSEGFNDVVQEWFDNHSNGEMWVDENNGLCVSDLTSEDEIANRMATLAETKAYLGI